MLAVSMRQVHFALNFERNTPGVLCCASNKKRDKSHSPKTTNLFKWLQILGKALLNFSDTSQSGHHHDDRCDNEKSKVLNNYVFYNCHFFLSFFAPLVHFLKDSNALVIFVGPQACPKWQAGGIAVTAKEKQHCCL